ncbi:MAG TPA: sugar transferase, partial [Candidatus Omnitrophota bacterium]|nr:sugar transferase [Candidatus Omnitrophota bacterium]
MIKERIALFRKLAILTDSTLVCAAFFIAYAVRHHLNDGVSGLYPLQAYIVFLPVILLVTGAMLYFFGIYDSFRTKTLWEVLVIVAKSHISSFVVFSSFVFIIQQSHISRAFIGLV